MKHFSILILMSVLFLTACDKEAANETPVAVNPVNPSIISAPPAAPPEAAESSPEAIDLANKQALLDYATMEDRYINDSIAKWAASAKASSTYGVTQEKSPAASSGYGPEKAAGAIDGNTWCNNSTDLGFDWLELGYDKPVNATEVRIVFKPNSGAEAVTKMELIDTDGKLYTVWSGISDVKSDARGSRTWFVRTFAATPYKVKAVKITLANNLYPGYKEIDAVQLVGE